ncbi:tryptophanyl-tRNA synthetase (TrpRS1) [Besnoitia besnoiti]|uniref:Tryptophanyl-tRNA synthetase (TrpRS1) n=1 Tax=Besnoitia besnoiti TaxID=94643 RepID=A0A2A9MBA4_BESBE|nr:tryptophanyl-tRNA synthetase (TrpRS1) [Besnoitia besnoiti]PFH32672.1 tryptophanyl-tRNA synthetase (TrpRS1) [Besnoitia besnoiti]
MRSGTMGLLHTTRYDGSVEPELHSPPQDDALFEAVCSVFFFGHPRGAWTSPRSRLRLSRAAGTSADGEGEPEQGGDELTAKKDGATTWIEEESRDRDRFFRGSHIMTGMQPSGRLHLGNFFAVVRPLATLQQCEASVTCLIGDLHATFGKISRRLHSGARGQEAAASAGDEAVFSLAGASGGGRRGDAARSPSGSFAADGAHSAGSAEKLRSISEDTLDAVAILLASGMSPALGDHLQETGTCGEPGKTVVAVQSLVPEHTMLATLLMGCTPLGWLERCTGASANIRRLNEDDATTKGSDGEDTPWQREGRADVGMRFYPLLMAADILAHDADYVLVGDDQCQHVEFTRQVGKRWNSMFLPQRPQEDRRRSAEGRTDPGRALLPGDRSSIRGRLASWTGLRLPRMLGYSRLSSRIGDLQNPTKKMSKSSSESIPGQVASSKGCVFLLDPPDVIAAKIAKAKTDTIRGLSYNMEGELRPRKGRADEPSSTEYRAACRNLLHLWSVITGQAPQDAAKRFSDAPWECFKTELTERLIDLLSPLQRQVFVCDTYKCWAIVLLGTSLWRNS